VCDPGQFRVLLPIKRGFYAVFVFSWGICVFIVAVAGLLSYVVVALVVALDCGGCRCLCHVWANARLTLVSNTAT
jgi:hypothetical protein